MAQKWLFQCFREYLKVTLLGSGSCRWITEKKCKHWTCTQENQVQVSVLPYVFSFGSICGEYLSIVLGFSWPTSHPEALVGRALPLGVTLFLFITCSKHIGIGFGHVILVWLIRVLLWSKGLNDSPTVWYSHARRFGLENFGGTVLILPKLLEKQNAGSKSLVSISSRIGKYPSENKCRSER